MNLDQLKKEFNERPLEVLAVLTAATLAVTKVVDTVASARSKNAYAKLANRRKR